MTDNTESFVHRWSRRAQQARHEEAAESAPPAEMPEAEPALDPEQQPELPDIESLDATSDYTAFLSANVPKAMRAAALRKAWTSDPVIAAHRPLVEYDWDCNAPGYGRLKPNDLTGKLSKDLLRHFRPKEEEPLADQPDILIAEAETPPDPALAPEHPEPVPQSATIEEDVAPGDAPAPPGEDGDQQTDDGDVPRTRIRHGSARPT